MAKKLVVLAILIFAAFFIINNFSSAEMFERSTAKALLPVRYAGLMAKEPEAKIQIPIRSVRKKQIADTWSAERTGGERRHQGQDIFAPRATPVYSATEGYVWRIGENSLGGNTVSVLGAGGRFYYYAHLERHAPELKTGDFVTPETVVGFVGTTGNARGTPPHLHFGVYTANGAINPLSLFE